MFSRVRCLAVACFLVSFTLAGPLSAATSLWWDPLATGGTNGGGAGTWNTASWYNGSSDAGWVSGDNAIFGGSAGGAVALNGAITATNLTFNTTGYTISPNSQTLTLSGGVVQMNAPSATISSKIAGSAGLTLNGSGNLALTPATVETISGTTYVNGGTLTLNSANSGGSGVLASSTFININSGGVLPVTGFNGIANGAGAGNYINVNPGGLLNGVGNQTCSGFIVLNGGTLASGSGQQLEVEAANYIQATANSTIAANSNDIWLQESGGSYSCINVASGATLTYLAPLTNGGNTSYLTKTGGGSLVFNGAANTYTGTTLVGAGTLSLQGAATIASTPLIGVAQGATLDVSGLTSTFTLGSAQTLVAGRIATWPTAASPITGTDINGNISSSGTIDSLGTTTVSGSVTLNGGYVAPDLSSASVGNIVTPALTITGTTTITPAFISNGTFPVVTSTAAIAGTGTMTLGNPIQGLANWRGGLSATSSLNIGANAVSVTYSGLTPASLTWSPTSSNPYAWNVVSTGNWKNNTSGGTQDVFYHGDAVTFPASTSGTVSIAGNVYPSSITFQNTGTFYINGAGAISGPASVTMNGTGTVVFAGNNTNNNNTFWGGTTINSGQVWLGSNVSGGANTLTENPSALGTGPITINTSGQLDLYPGSTKENFYISNAITLNGGSIVESDGHQYLEGPLTVNNGGGTLYAAFGAGYNSFGSGNKYVVIDGAISGSGALYFSWAGYGTQANYFVNSPNPNYTGTVTFNTTTYDYLLSANAFPNATVNAIGEIGSFTTTANFGALEGNGTIPLTTTNNSPTPGVPVALTVGSLGKSTTFSGTLNGAGSLTLVGGSLTFTGLNVSYTGITAINGGTLAGGSLDALSLHNAVTIGTAGSNGVLDLDGNNQQIYSLGTGSGAVAANQVVGNSSQSSPATLTVSGGASTYGGVIQDTLGSGNEQTLLNVAGGARLTLTGSILYTGATTVSSASTLQIGNGGSLPSLASQSITDSGVFAFNHNDNATYAGQIFGGGGSVYNNGGGTLNLTGQLYGVSVVQPGPGTLNLTGNLNDGSNPGSLRQQGGVILLQQSNGYSGGTIISSGSLLVAAYNALGSGSLTMSGGTLNLGGNGVNVGAVSMTGGLITGSPGSVSGSSLNVAGPGVSTLDVPVSLVGGATIASGTLALTTNGALSVGSSLTIVPGGVWDVSAFGVSGGTFGPGGALVAGRTASFNTDINGSLNINSAVLSASPSSRMTISGGLAMTSGTLSYATGGTVAVGGALNFTGGSDIVAPQTLLSSGTYSLFTYGSLTGGSAAALADLQMGGPYGSNPNYTYTFHATGSGLTLTVRGSNSSLVWSGGSNQTWDVGTSQSWFNASINGLDSFYSGDSVTFNDSPGTATTVTINATVLPGSVTVSNTNENYTFQGNGTIAGATSLVKNGPGSLTLQQTNSYSGVTAINGGTLAIGTTNALPITGAVTIGTAGSSGVLDLAGNSQQIFNLSTGSGAVAANQVVGNSSQFSPATLTVSGGTSTFGGTIQDTLGNGSSQTLLNVANGAVFTLTGSNTYTGATSVDSISTLQIGNGGSGASLASQNISGGGTLIFNHNDNTTYGGQIYGVSVVQLGSGTLNLTGNISDNYPALGSLKQQGGMILVTQYNSYSGGTVVSSGLLQIAANNALGSGNLTMSGGALSSSDITPYTLPNNLVLSGSVTLGDPVNNGALEFSGAANTLAGNTYLTVNSPVAIENGIGGSHGLTVNGGSVLALNAQCTYSGSTTVNGGTLQLNYGAAGAGGGTLISPEIIVNGGGFLALTASTTNGVLGYYGGRSALVINDGIVANNSSVNTRETLENTLTMTGGTLTGTSTGDGHGVFSLDAENGAIAVNATSDAAGNPAVINAASIGLQTTSVIVNVTRGPASPPADLIIDSNIQNFNYGTGTNPLIVQGSGILALTGSNRITGAVTIGGLTGGTTTVIFEPGSQTRLPGISDGGAAGAVTLSGSSQLYIGTGGITALNNATTYNLNGGTLGAYATWSSSAAMTIGGPLTIDNGGDGITLSGSLSGSGSLTEVGSGNLTLSGTNTYTGGTVVNNGVLYAHSDLALGAVPSSFQPANITLNGGELRDNSNAASSGGSSLNLSASRGITLGPAGGVLRAGWSNTTTVNGVVSGGSLTIANDGQGFNPPSNVYLANIANTYTGSTTIGGGALPSSYNFEGISTLTVAHLANGGQNSSIGASSNAAANLVFNSLNYSYTSSAGTGVLNYAGTGDSTDRLFTIASGAVAEINNNGTGPLNFTNAGAIALTSTLASTLALGGTYAGPTANTFAPQVTDNGALPTTLAVNGSLWTLTGTNTYTGGTYVTNGTLILANDEAIEEGTSLYVGNDLTVLGDLISAPTDSSADRAIEASVAADHASAAAVPEPGTLGLLMTGAAVGLLAARRRRQTARS